MRILIQDTPPGGRVLKGRKDFYGRGKKSYNGWLTLFWYWMRGAVRVYMDYDARPRVYTR